MSEETDRMQDQELVNTVDALVDRGDLLDADGEPSDERRAFVETFGLLAYASEPRAPRAELKARILAKVGHDAREASGDQQAFPTSSAAGGWRSRGWALPMAATLVLGLLGLSGWQIWRVERLQATVLRLERALGSARREVSTLRAVRLELAEARSRLTLVTASTSEFCPLRPPPGSPRPSARGTLVMQAGSGDWLLTVEGLEVAGAGREYRMWFVTEDGPVPAGGFDVGPTGGRAELHSKGMPVGLLAVMVTLEPIGASQPRGDMEPLLYGDERIRLL